MRNSDSDTAPPGFERSLAVVIGINSYSHGIPPLLNAVRDATAVADSLERQGFEVLRLLDAEATLSSLSHLLSHHLPSLESPPDRLLIYFAGHGLAHTDDEHQLSGFLLPSDARRDDTSSYWPMAALREALSHLPCRHLLLILDCCFAGAFPHSPSRDIRAPSVPAPLYLERFRHFSSRRSFQLLLSTAHDELASDRLLAKPSQESLGDGLHSPFALALLQGLQPLSPADSNQDGLLTAAELYTFLRDRLLSLVPSHCQQTPSLWHLDWHDGGEFLFLLSDAFPSLPPAAPLSQRSNPYLGLRPFSSAQRHLFFGRERLVDSLLERLRSQPLLLLCGPSGAGKSSLVHAGLLPRLTEDPSWRVPPSLRPSSQPFHALSSWLASLAPETAAPSAADLASRPRSAAEFLGSFLVRHPERSVLLVIDPLEEIVTSCLDDSLRRAFLRALSGLLQLSHPRLHLLLLLRSDFEPHFLALLQPCAIPASLWHGGRLNLQPMNRDELRRCIEKPAEACVLFFSPGLIERLLDDVEQMPGALPLLSVALSELFGAYLSSGRNDRTLCFEDYHHIGGGIAGALQRRAELVFSGTPPPLSEGQPALPPVPASELPAFQCTLRNVLLRMVAPEGGELARRRVPRSELEYPHREENARVQRVLRTLEASRLVVASDDGGPCIEPAHDALLSAWPRLHDWARHAQRELLLLRRVSHAASEWHRHRPTADFLWADARLDQLDLAPASLRRTDVPLALPTTSHGNQPTEPLALNASESGFLRASAERRRFLRARRNTLALTVAVMLVALTVAALFQANKATDNAREAQRQQVAAETNEQEARNQKEAAELNLKEAQRQRGIAELNAKEAQQQKQAAEANLREARRQQEAADSNAREAQRQQETAEANAREAQKQQQLADDNAREARSQRSSSEANAQEARKQQKAAEANAQEARKQQQVADTNAQEARKQQQASESNFRNARRQQEAADTNAREAQKQQEAAEASAREALRQQQIADANAREAQKQQEAAEASARFAHAERFSEEDPTKALLILLDGGSWPEALGDSLLQTIWDISQRVISIAVLDGPGVAIETAVFSPDGSRILVCHADNTARVWSSDGTGTPVILTGHRATFSPDSTRVLSISNDGSVYIWHADGSGTPITLTGRDSNTKSAFFSPDGTRVLTISNDGSVHIWHADGSGTPIALTGRASSAIFSPDGTRVLTVTYDGSVRIWHADGSGTPIVLTGRKGQVAFAVFSPNGTRVLVASDGIADIWHTDRPSTPITLTGNTGSIYSATFSPDGYYVTTTSVDHTVRIWRVNSSLNPLVLPATSATPATLSPNGVHVLTTDDSTSDHHVVRIWRADGSGTPVVLAGHTALVTSATFSPDGSYVLTTSEDRTVRIWRTDGSSGPNVRIGYHTGSVQSATSSADGSRVLTVSNDGIVHIWRTDSFSIPVVLNDHTNRMRSASFSPDDSCVLTISYEGTVHIWRADGSGTPIGLTGHKGWVTSAIFSPDGSRILTTASDGAAYVWRADGSGTPITLTGHKALVTATFSPDGSRVLTADGAARIWQADGSGPPIVLTDYTDRIYSATFSPNGNSVLTVSNDGIARIWQADDSKTTNTQIVFSTPYPGHSPWVYSATFSPNGIQILTTAFREHTPRIWNAAGYGTPINLTGHTVPVISTTFSFDGSRVLSTSYDGTTRISRVEEGAPPLIIHHASYSKAFFLPDGTRIVSFSEDGTISIWPITSAGLLNSLRNAKATKVCLSASDRGRYLFESPEEARKGYEHCERSFGRNL